MAYHQIISSPDRKYLYTIGNKFKHQLSSSGYDKNIYKFSCTGNPGISSNCKWTEIPTKLKYGRNAATAFPIPDALAKKICM